MSDGDDQSEEIDGSKLPTRTVEVDVIVPVYNAAATLESTLNSAFSQVDLQQSSADDDISIKLYVCCYDDGSTDESWTILERIQQKTSNGGTNFSILKGRNAIETYFCIAKSADGVSRGAGYARNQAVKIRRAHSTTQHCFLCLLDSDDLMHPTRVSVQVRFMMSLSEDERHRTLLGSRFVRDPPESTWHYSDWANHLTPQRLYLERFREVTLLQPTWMISRRRFEELNGYIEAPHPSREAKPGDIMRLRDRQCQKMCLVHPVFDNALTLRVAEDLRFFHTHLATGGLLRLPHTSEPLVTYRHRVGLSQSSQTPRKLLLQLRAFAFEECILKRSTVWQENDGAFVVWGAGRDGKDFVKALNVENRKRVYCFVDVDEKKIEAGFYVNREGGLKIPILHFSYLIRDSTHRDLLRQCVEQGSESDTVQYGKITKGRSGVEVDSVERGRGGAPASKRRKTKELGVDSVDTKLLQKLPVVVCVAMYRTNGALEHNVSLIGRREGEDLWHFS